MRFRLAAALVLTASLAGDAEAGLFKKGAKPDPAKAVPLLIETLKTSKDDDKRAEAAEELREYSAKEYPEILPALIDALGGDSSTTVRVDAADSLGKLRPITQKAGYALEQALQHDSTIRVRVAARTSLWLLNLEGYRGGKVADSTESAEPPLAGAKAPPKSPPAVAVLPKGPPKEGLKPAVPHATSFQSAEPPLAPPLRPAKSDLPPPLLPARPDSPPAVPPKFDPPPEPPKFELPAASPSFVPFPSAATKPTAPTPVVPDDGPALGPPK